MKNFIKLTIFASLLTVSLFGCGIFTEFSPATKNQPLLEPFTGEVKVLDSLPEKYTDVGWVQVQASGDYHWGMLLDSAKEKAALSGANAIVFTPANQKMAPNKTIFCRAILL